MSLGRSFAGHSLPHKLKTASSHGFLGIELFYEDLVDLAAGMPGGGTSVNQLAAAEHIRRLCASLGLNIVCLQPFMHYGGLKDREVHHQRLSEIEVWTKLAHALGTDLICFPSSFLPEEQVTDDFRLIVRDFTQAAEIGLSKTPVVRFCFEALCWGTRVDTWQGSWEIVQRVNRPNFGLCLDTFNVAGRIYADPGAASGRLDNCEAAVQRCVRELSAVDAAKVFLLQIADGERLSAPLDEAHPFYSSDQPSRMSWSRNSRLFYGESDYGGYLPIRPIMSAIVHGLGYSGWCSFEVFNRCLASKDVGVPAKMARRARISWEKLQKDVRLNDGRHGQEQASPML